MLTYRTFRNFDPPALASLWRDCAANTAQTISPDLLEQLVFAKLYFDYNGLFLAIDDGHLLGYAHAGFGPNETRDWISHDRGVICIVMVRPGDMQREITNQLLANCEEYLGRHGAREIFCGGFTPLNPFYTGLYGGSELPGILDSDVWLHEILASRGYQQQDRLILLHRDLHGFEAPIDRRQMQIRRQMVVEATIDAKTNDWWEATTVGEFDLSRFELVPRVGGPPVARACFRSMEPSGTVSLLRAVGLLEVTVAESYRRHGLAVFILSEAFRQFIRQGIMEVTAQVRKSMPEAIGLFQKLGFKTVDQGTIWKKA